MFTKNRKQLLGIITTLTVAAVLIVATDNSNAAPEMTEVKKTLEPDVEELDTSSAPGEITKLEKMSKLAEVLGGSHHSVCCLLD
jgi:hypothetical protein